MSHSAASLARLGLQPTQRFGGFVNAGFGGGDEPAAGLDQVRRVQLDLQQEPEVVLGPRLAWILPRS